MAPFTVHTRVPVIRIISKKRYSNKQVHFKNQEFSTRVRTIVDQKNVLKQAGNSKKIKICVHCIPTVWFYCDVI